MSELQQGNGSDRCQQALSEINDLVARIAHNERLTITDVFDVYRIATQSGAYEAQRGANASEACSDVIRAGTEFLQLADAAERYQDSPEALRSWMDLSREVALSWMADRTVPEWSDRGGPHPHRP